MTTLHDPSVVDASPPGARRSRSASAPAEFAGGVADTFIAGALIAGGATLMALAWCLL